MFQRASPASTRRSCQTLGLMKNVAIRTALVVGLTVLTWAVPAEAGYIATAAWAVSCGAAFAVAATILLDASLRFVASVAFLTTAVLPVAILLAIAKPVYGDWARSAVELAGSTATLLPMKGLEFALPTLAAIAATAITSRLVASRKQLSPSVE